MRAICFIVVLTAPSTATATTITNDDDYFVITRWVVRVCVVCAIVVARGVHAAPGD